MWIQTLSAYWRSALGMNLWTEMSHICGEKMTRYLLASKQMEQVPCGNCGLRSNLH